jgi:hypothetical protein
VAHPYNPSYLEGGAGESQFKAHPRKNVVNSISLYIYNLIIYIHIYMYINKPDAMVPVCISSSQAG